MVKSIIKETIIMLLLCIAIILILGILFYDYIPTNKVIPTKEAYSTPENVKEEIEEEITKINNTEEVYKITAADLNIYRQSNSYIPGKDNPFALVNIQNSNAVINDTQAGDNHPSGGESNTNQGGNSNENGNSTGTFFNDVK